MRAKMKKVKSQILYTILFVMVSLGMLGCASNELWLPRAKGFWPKPQKTLIWHGTGISYRLENKKWKRIPSFDYTFTVVQRRYGDTWQSTKTMQRQHPAYDGSAGPRTITYHFSIKYPKTKAEQMRFAIRSSIGSGHGKTDGEFRNASMEISAEPKSSFAPFNTYRLTQNYLYEKGELHETLHLVKRHSGGETPWVKVMEKAKMFGHKRFAKAP